MKLTNVINKVLDIVASSYFLFTWKRIYVSFAIPRFKRDNHNWGDDVNFVIVEKLSGKKVIPYKFSLFKKTNYLVIGSVIQWYSNSRSIIWGAGFLYETNNIKKPKKVLAVRGPLTRQCLLNNGINCPEIYGDPALLFPRIYQPAIKNKFDLGIIQHYSENRSIQLPLHISSDRIKYINIANYGRWEDFIDRIVSCKAVISSSLHGLIVSEAYEIPNIWTVFTDSEISADKKFKYIDFYMSVNKNINSPFVYNSIVANKNLVQFVQDNWQKPEINLDILINSCPFKFKDILLKS
ncbi:MAG: polysaccharide pyruvyl transferase family protein [bacterium]